MVTLAELYKNDIQLEKLSFERINSLSIATHHLKNEIDGLWYLNKTFALYFIFVEQKIDEAKSVFYNCGRLDEFLIKNYQERILDYGVDHITFALLCDNVDIINRYANLSHPWFAHTIKSGSLVHAMQCIIKEDWQALEQDIATYERITTTQKGKINIPDLMYFKGMLQKNKAMIEEALLLLLKDHKKRNKYMGIAQDYISIPALGYAKLAWLKGIEVQIDHPLIPKELLPYRPLPKYEDKYDFLK